MNFEAPAGIQQTRTDVEGNGRSRITSLLIPAGRSWTLSQSTGLGRRGRGSTHTRAAGKELEGVARRELMSRA